MNEPLRIAVDLDGVLYDFEGACRFLLEENFGLVVPRPSTSWNFIKNYCRDEGKPEAWGWLWTEGVKQGLFRYGHLLKGARRAMHALSAQGHSLVTITKRPRTAREDTLDWLGFYRLPMDEVHVLEDRSKASVLPQCDLYLDDSLDNVEELVTRLPSASVLLWDQPWNQEPVLDWFMPGRCRRVYAWDQVLEEVAAHQDWMLRRREWKTPA